MSRVWGVHPGSFTSALYDVDVAEGHIAHAAVLWGAELDVAAKVSRDRGAPAEGNVRDRHWVGGAHDEAVTLLHHGVLDQHIACGRLHADGIVAVEHVVGRPLRGARERAEAPQTRRVAQQHGLSVFDLMKEKCARA